MTNDPKTDNITDLATEAAGRLHAATSILQDELDQVDISDGGGWRVTLAIEAVQDVEEALLAIAAREDVPMAGGEQ